MFSKGDKINDRYEIIKLIGEDVVLKAYFTNNLNLIIDSLMSSTKKTRDEIINYIIGIDYLYEKESNLKK